MYTIVHRYNIKPDAVNQVIQLAVEGFVPLVSRAQGFLAYELINTGSGTVTTISTFQNQVAAEHSNIVADRWVAANLSEFVIEPPLVMSGKVSVHKTIHEVR